MSNTPPKSQQTSGGLTCARIKAALKERIENGELVEGSRVPSEHELARNHGLSRNQAREALRELELEGYIIRRRGSGSYVAPLDGRITAIRAVDTGAVALVFPQYLSRYSREVFDGFMQHMAEAGRQTITYNWQQDSTAEVRLLRTLADSGVAGIVAWVEHDNEETQGLVAEMRSQQFPIVLIDRFLHGVDADCVSSDNELIGYRLTQALVKKGHRRIGFLGLQYEPPSSIRDRLRGYRKVLKESGIPYDERIVGGERQRVQEDPAWYANAFMAFADRPTAFVCIHDQVMKLFYDELIRLGYSVPDQVEFAALDDGHPPERPEIPMVRMRQKARTIGTRSAAMLLERIESPDMPARRISIEPSSVDFATEIVEARANAAS